MAEPISLATGRNKDFPISAARAPQAIAPVPSCGVSSTDNGGVMSVMIVSRTDELGVDEDQLAKAAPSSHGHSSRRIVKIICGEKRSEHAVRVQGLAREQRIGQIDRPLEPFDAVLCHTQLLLVHVGPMVTRSDGRRHSGTAV